MNHTRKTLLCLCFLIFALAASGSSTAAEGANIGEKAQVIKVATGAGIGMKVVKGAAKAAPHTPTTTSTPSPFADKQAVEQPAANQAQKTAPTKK